MQNEKKSLLFIRSRLYSVPEGYLQLIPPFILIPVGYKFDPTQTMAHPVS